MNKCLMKAVTSGYNSISFPALGTGNLQYPPEMVAQWMIESVIDHCDMFPRSLLTSVNIVVYHKDADTQKVDISSLF